LPAYKEIQNNGASVCIWEITETKTELESLYFGKESPPENAPEQREIEWYASRLALQTATGIKHLTIKKDQYGKPQIPNVKGYVSLSHTVRFTAAVYHPEKAVGIDLEHMTPRIERIARRFLHPEEIAWMNSPPSLEELYLIWCTKEAVFKRYGSKAVDFKNHIQVSQTNLSSIQGDFTFNSQKEDRREDLGHFLKFDDHFMVWL
jgi:4'-phosphopantetheinyl transferase